MPSKNIITAFFDPASIKPGDLLLDLPQADFSFVFDLSFGFCDEVIEAIWLYQHLLIRLTCVGRFHVLTSKRALPFAKDTLDRGSVRLRSGQIRLNWISAMHYHNFVYTEQIKFGTRLCFERTC